MEVIKKRLQANKLELENALERAELAEGQLKQQAARAERAETEAEALARRIGLLEQDLERAEQRLALSQQKLELASQTADEAERKRKMLEHRANTDEERLEALEASLRDTRLLAEDSDRKYDEVARKLALAETELERAQQRSSSAEKKLGEQEDELKQVGNNLRTLELNEERALDQLQAYEQAARLDQQRALEAESRAEFAERSARKLHKEIEQLEVALLDERKKYKHISDELDQTFSELAAC